MRKTLALVAAILVGAVTTATTAVGAQSTQTKPAEATKICTLKVAGMTCAGCEAAVKIAAKQIDGVKDVKASYAKGTAEVTFDSAKTTPDTIAKVIAQKTGYKTQVTK
jgi:copper chaperone CopZ